MYAAYKSGRLAKDPATFWYKGEIGFFGEQRLKTV